MGIEEEAERCVRGVRAQQTGAGTRTLDLCEVGVGSAGLQQLRPLVRLVGELRDKAKHAVERGLERQKCLAGVVARRGHDGDEGHLNRRRAQRLRLLARRTTAHEHRPHDVARLRPLRCQRERRE